MEYTESIGDRYETYEGTPEEIAELLMRKPERLLEPVELNEEFTTVCNCKCGQRHPEELIDYIEYELFRHDMRVDRKAIRKILELAKTP